MDIFYSRINGPSNRIRSACFVIVMSDFKVIIGGHSQLADSFPDLDKTELIQCKVRGAKLADFWNHSTFRSMRENRHILDILFLGGNDTYDNCDFKVIVSDICLITDHIE